MDAMTLISSSMRLIGALDSGEVPSADEANDALMVLNQMLDSWLADRLMAFSINIEEFSLTVGQQTYSMGPGGNFDTVRPVQIDRISIVSLTNPAQPLELPIPILTDWDWQNVPVKNIQSTLPINGVYDDGAFPRRNLTYIYIPTMAVKTRIYSWKQLSAFPDLVTDLTFPPGYSEAFRYNLALRLIAEFPGDYTPVMTQTTAQLATDSLARVKSLNNPKIQAFCDAALLGQGGHYNYYSDTVTGGWASRG